MLKSIDSHWFLCDNTVESFIMTPFFKKQVFILISLSKKLDNIAFHYFAEKQWAGCSHWLFCLWK